MRKEDSENINIKLSFAVFVLPSLRATHPQKLEVYRDIMNIISQKIIKIIILKKAEETVGTEICC